MRAMLFEIHYNTPETFMLFMHYYTNVRMRIGRRDQNAKNTSKHLKYRYSTCTTSKNIMVSKNITRESPLQPGTGEGLFLNDEKTADEVFRAYMKSDRELRKVSSKYLHIRKTCNG